MFDRLPPKRMCSGSRDLFKCWEISDHRFSRLGRTPTCERRTDSQPFETFAEKYLPNDVSTIVLTVEKIFTVVTPKKKTKNRHLYATAATKKKNVTPKPLHAHTINIPTLVCES